jgi:hypothetical protein
VISRLLEAIVLLYDEITVLCRGALFIAVGACGHQFVLDEGFHSTLQ